MLRHLVLALAFLLAVPALAQVPGTCALGTAERALDVSRVYARLFNTGSLFFGSSTTNGTGYIVPIQAAASPVFAAGIWVGGLVGGDLRVAGARYEDFEFWPGPLDDEATLPDPDDCSAFDRIWLVSAGDLARYEATGEATDDLAAWPVGLGAETVDAGGNPVVPTSREQIVDLAAGERPVVFGSQTAFWVMNDVGNVHLSSQTEPIGLEVQATAFAVASREAVLDRATFYRYRLVNRNALPFEEARFGFWQDPDLGDASDDFAGVDTTRSLGFVYNADAFDEPPFGYGEQPPAFGVDFLDGLEVFSSCGNVSPFDPPLSGFGSYNCLRGLWRDGTPITENGTGYMTDGPVTTFAYPGDPVTQQFWSEENSGIDRPTGGDRRSISASPAFTLAPGETRDFHLALVFGQGTDRLDSVTELRTASDLVQAAYNDGSLFDTVLPDSPVVLAAPRLIGPEDGATVVDVSPRLAWGAVAGAVYYRVELSRSPDFAEREVIFTTEPGAAVPLNLLSLNALTGYVWRVRAGDAADGISPFSETRSFEFYRYLFDDFGRGVGIIETASPNTEVCPDADDPGCAAGYPGNTVWLSPNASADYVVTNSDNDLFDLLQNGDTIDGDNFEMRFMDACASAGACLGIYAGAAPAGNDLIVSVPFELWNTGAKENGETPVRMIPIVRPLRDTELSADWADTFPGVQDVVVDGEELEPPVTHRVLGMMPDRETGYALFEAAANGFGGPGATYDPEADGDTQEDIYTDPFTGATSPCRSQNYYVDFCYRDGNDRFVAPLGGLDGIQLADLAGDGSTPPAGTVIRFDANERLLPVDAEDDVPAQPAAFALGAAYPNPFRSSATVPFELGEAGRVRLAVLDVLGREVAVLHEGVLAAGAHRATLDGSRLASGVYLVVLEAGGQRQATRVLLLR
ncbi:MAG: T9SS type A sorting domain-containing protein [Bacteroidota bacterium]